MHVFVISQKILTWILTKSIIIPRSALKVNFGTKCLPKVDHKKGKFIAKKDTNLFERTTVFFTSRTSRNGVHKNCHVCMLTYIIFISYLCVHTWFEKEFYRPAYTNIYVLRNGFRCCLFQLHYLHKTSATKNYNT